jgi:hypothetical protein
VEQWVQGETNWRSFTNLLIGNYTWWVQGWNAAGYGPWSAASHFAIPSDPPGVATPLSPHLTEVSNALVRYTWSAASNAVWYRLCVVKSNAIFHDHWYYLSDSRVDSTTGKFAVDVPSVYHVSSAYGSSNGGHFSGVYHWCVQAWNLGGLGPWSSMGSFTVPNLAPGAVTLLSQTNTLDIEPEIPSSYYCMIYTWSKQPNATYYEFCLVRNATILDDFWTSATPFDLWNTQFSLRRTSLWPGAYHWWVRAWNPDGMGPWSSSLSFTIGE